MPRYELMYLLAGTVTDDEQSGKSAEIREIAEKSGATQIEEDFLGKKKLAYPIGKTKNGFYGVLTFDMNPVKLAGFDAKLRTMKNIIIRYLIVNIDEHLKRSAKDKAVRASMPARTRTDDDTEITPEKNVVEEAAPEVEAKPKKAKKNLEEQIEDALTEQIN